MRKAAIFDLDGTLVPGTSTERIFMRHLALTGQLGLFDVLRFFMACLNHLGRWDRMVLQNKSHFMGRSLDKLRETARECFSRRTDRLVPQRMRRLIEDHRNRGDLLLLISGALSFIVDIFAHELSFDDKKGTDLELNNGKLSGRIAGVHPRSHGKVVILDGFAKRYRIDLADSAAYADHFSDRFFLGKVGRPVAVNPDRRLLKLAQQSSWEIMVV